MGRAQSNVVGAVLLVGVTVVGLGVLTASVGTLVESGTARADAARVADGFADVRPAETTGPDAVRLSFVAGELYTADRDLRVVVDGRVVAHRRVDALRFDGERGGATFVAGAVVRRGPDPTLVRPPRVRATDRRVLVSVPVLRGDLDYAGTGGVEVTLRVDVGHARTRLGSGRVRVAVETATPAPLARHFRDRPAVVSATRRDVDDDGIPSVLVTFAGNRTAHLFTHRTEVRAGD